MTEAKIQLKISQYLKDMDYIVVKNMSMSLNGWPDLSCYGPNGEHFMIEVKTPTGRLSNIQKYRIAKLRAKHHTVYVVDSVTKLKEEMNESI